MWMQFALAMLIALILLYLPGTLVLRAFRLPFAESALLAAPVTIAIGQIAFILYAALHIRVSPLTLLPLLSVIVLAWLISEIVSHRRLAKDKAKKSFSPSPLIKLADGRGTVWWLLGAFGFAIIITVLLFVRNLDGADSYSQLYDNAWHLSIIKHFTQTGDYSALTSGHVVPTTGSAFYPTGWHALVALLSTTTGLSIPLCVNATLAVTFAIVFPLSMFVFLQYLFRGHDQILITSAFLILAFAAFPWRFAVFGPLWSNLFSFALLPVLMTEGMAVFSHSSENKLRIRMIIVGIISIIGIALTQPNSLFTFACFVAIYIFTQIDSYVRAAAPNATRRNHIIASTCSYLGFAVAIGVIWIGIFSLPFMSRTVHWSWPSFESFRQAIIDCLFLGFHDSEPQLLLGALVILGIIWTLFNREWLWVSCAYGLFAILYTLAAATDGRTKEILTGFWYHDAYRLGASAIFAAIPLAGIGLLLFMRICIRLVDGLMFKKNDGKASVALSAIIGLAVLAVNFFPNYYFYNRQTVKTSMGMIAQNLEYTNSRTQPKSYTQTESDFVNKVKKITHDDPVLNEPNDGSVYAYAINGVNVYYKAWVGNWMGPATADSRLFMSSLNDLANNAQVRSALRRNGIHYILLLNRPGFHKDPTHTGWLADDYTQYNPSEWQGIDRITDKTPGLTVVLRQGRMRLYKIN